MLGDITGNGEAEVVVTISNAAEGSRMAVFNLDGDGKWQVLVPNQRRNTLVVATVTLDGVAAIWMTLG